MKYKWTINDESTPINIQNATNSAFTERTKANHDTQLPGEIRTGMYLNHAKLEYHSLHATECRFRASSGQVIGCSAKKSHSAVSQAHIRALLRLTHILNAGSELRVVRNVTGIVTSYQETARPFRHNGARRRLF